MHLTNRSILLAPSVLMLSTLMLSSALLAGCAGGPQASDTGGADAAASDISSTEPIASPTATLVVHGMSCPLCANNVDAQLLDIQGVQSVNVDMGSGEVKVAFKPGATVSRAQLARAIDRSGFTLAGLSTP